uniref:Amine oxidase domain-containing protein n=1 Tax=Paramoeba aestuarina TaxID=180227 RepID=A0A7S4KRC2_9EUKA
MEEGIEDPMISYLEELSTEYIPDHAETYPHSWQYSLIRCQHLEGTHPSQLGLRGISECNCPVNLTKNLAVIGGFGKVVQLLEKKIREKGGKIHLSSPVTHIQWEEGRGGTIAWEELGEGNEERRDQKSDFDGVIVCLPVGCYEDVMFSPLLPSEKTKAMSCLNQGTTEKHILIFDKIFWKSSRFTILDLECCFTSLEKSTGKPLLYCWISRNSPYYDSPPEFFADLVRNCWDPVRESDAKLVDFIRSTWTTDKWSKGSFLSPGLGSQGPKDFETIQKPIPPLFFAGEGTGERYGETSGAFITGRQAAMQFLSQIEEQSVK